MNGNLPQKQDFIIYVSADGKIKLETRIKDETIWLTQDQIAALFDTSKQNVGQHIKNIFEEAELQVNRTVKNFFTVQDEGKRSVKRSITHYNLDMIISVGYRIKSTVATHFRIWATQKLKEYIVKGFVLNDERFKKGNNEIYFEELLARIRDIRSSEKVFWRKVLDIYATSVDYNSKADITKEFFKVVQNKMHWAAHGKTAAEIIFERADSAQPNMGLTSWSGDKPRKQDTDIAKNYLVAEELDILNRIVTAYLELAELQALNRVPMYMKDWLARLDDFLKMTGRDILTHAGKISQKVAEEKAAMEYNKYKKSELAKPTQVELDFIEAEKELKRLE